MQPHVPQCPWCKTEESAFLCSVPSIDGHAYRLLRCSECKTVFFDFQNGYSTKTETVYTDEYYGTSSTKFHPAIERILDYFRGSRAREVADLVPPSSRILDVGCGNGGFLNCLAKIGFSELYGVELPGKAAERSEKIKAIRLYVGDVLSADFPANSFDVITLFHVFEHLEQPQQTLRYLVNRLKPGGYLILTLPNIDSFQFQLFGWHWLHLDPPRHRFFITPQTLKAQMLALGLSCVSERYGDLEQNPFGFIQSFLNAMSFKRDALFERFKGNKNYAGPMKFGAMVQLMLALGVVPLAVILNGVEGILHKGATMKWVFRK